MKTLILVVMLFPLMALSCDGGIVKKTLKEIPIGSPFANDLTENEFKSIIKKFEDFFTPMVSREQNADLIIFKSWGSNTINAYAERESGKVMITIYGGLARHRQMTRDSLMLTLCHELGHHFGGYPKKTTNTWSSAEGQADYYSTSKCLRRIWGQEDNAAIMSQVNVPELVRKECGITYQSEHERALCARMALAGQAMALVFQDLDHDSAVPRFETPETFITRSMVYMHPFSQCRLDTYFHGAFCEVPESIEFDDYDPNKGACSAKLGHTRGLRPACWFVARN